MYGNRQENDVNLENGMKRMTQEHMHRQPQVVPTTTPIERTRSILLAHYNRALQREQEIIRAYGPDDVRARGYTLRVAQCARKLSDLDQLELTFADLPRTGAWIL